jgi:DNA-binding response OmpR family regulator/F0F1-type ATP synthase delta subunit
MKPDSGSIAFAGRKHEVTAPAAHILIVEDDVALRTLLTEILREDGYEVTAVDDGAAALRALALCPFQAMLTDMHLPGMDGLELLRRMRLQYPRTVGIVMTGFGTVDVAVKAMKAGAVDFLTKPFQTDLVSLTLKRVLEVQELRQENAILKHTVLKQYGIQVRTFEMEDMDGTGASVRQERGAAAVGAALMKQEFERGLAEGERAATDRNASRIASQCGLLGQAIRQVEQAYQGVLADMEAQTVALAFEIAKRVIHECVEEKRDIVLAQVRSAIARVRDVVREHALVRIRVHPTDVAMIEDVRSTLAAQFEGPVLLTVEGDSTIAPGGCVVQTGTRLVDATLDSQLSRLADPFRGKQTREIR